MEFNKVLNRRYSCRAFAARGVEQEKVDWILEAGRIAPTAVNNQPFKIWVIRSAEAKEKLLSFTKMKFIEPASVIFVIGSNADYAWVRPYDQKNFADIDASIVTTQMMLEIHDLGYGSTWIGHFDAVSIKDFFPDMNDYELIALLPVGIMAEDCAPSERHAQSKSREELVEFL
jgi:nitroreductase